MILDMITNRTQEDVDTALRIRAEKVQKLIQLDAEDVEVLERGTITINTLNRIESNQYELGILLAEMGYYSRILTKLWDETKIFNEAEFQRIVDNTNILRNAFFTFHDTPQTPPVSYHYKDINSLEKILFDIERMIDDVKNNYRECGTFECGEE